VQPRGFIFLKVDQYLGQPLTIVTHRQPSDQRGAVDLWSRKRVEELAGSGLTDRSDDPIADVVVVEHEGNPSEPRQSTRTSKSPAWVARS